MNFMPIETLTRHNVNKYQAVMMAAREARRINRIPKEDRGEYANMRVTILAMRRVAEGKVTISQDGEKAEKR
jgi:DNA-directed RNA polymerase subunit K/omega